MSILSRVSRGPIETLAALLLLAGLADASTWIVDIANGPGAQFTEIKDALQAAAPGDVILIRPGSYAPLRGTDAVQKGVTLIGQGTVDFNTNYVVSVEVLNVPASQTLIFANISGRGWNFTNCQGAVVLRESKATWGVTAASCSDVRVQSMSGPIGRTSATSSRMEIVDCTIYGTSGSSGQSCNAWWPATSGGPGIYASSGSRIHLVRSSAFGGAGGFGPSPGNGGPGAQISQSVLWIDGGGGAILRGGPGGLGDWCVSFYDGADGSGVVASSGSSVIRWGATLQPPLFPSGGTPGYPIVLQGGSTDQQITPNSPLLSFDRPPVPGSGVMFRVDAPPGMVVRLNLGREPQVLATPSVGIENLLVKTQSYDLGVVPASGRLYYRLRVPARWDAGERLFAQAQSVDPGSAEVRRTSSSMLLVR